MFEPRYSHNNSGVGLQSSTSSSIVKSLLVEPQEKESRDSKAHQTKQATHGISSDYLLLQKRAFFWDFLLRTYQNSSVCIRNEEIETILNKHELPNQRVVKADALRTRPQQFDDRLRLQLEKLLTFYCVHKGISYKQGLNEVAGPFCLFLKSNDSLSSAFKYYETFIDRFIPTLYIDKDFQSLQCYFNLFSQLIRYHDCELHRVLSDSFISPELYATPWFLTLFANKMKIEELYCFWEIYILENDCHFVFFLSLALLQFNREKILCGDPAMIPYVLTHIEIASFEEVKAIYSLALKLKESTPISFGMKVESMHLMDRVKCESNREEFFEQMGTYAIEIEEKPALPIHALDVLKTEYPMVFHCGNIYCSTNTHLSESLLAANHLSPTSYFRPKSQNQKEQGKNSITNFMKECSYCRNEVSDRNEMKGFLRENSQLSELLQIQKSHYNSARKSMSGFHRKNAVTIIDLREPNSSGSITANRVRANPSSASHSNQGNNTSIPDIYSAAAQSLLSTLISNNPSVNTAAATTATSNAAGAQNNNNKKNQAIYFLLSDSPASCSDPEEQKYLNAFIEEFAECDFGCLGIIEGGFKQLHSLLLLQGITINDHDNQTCHLCNPHLLPKPLLARNSHHSKSKSKNFFERMADVFAFNDDNNNNNNITTQNNQSSANKAPEQRNMSIPLRNSNNNNTSSNNNLSRQSLFPSANKSNSSNKDSQQQQQQQQPQQRIVRNHSTTTTSIFSTTANTQAIEEQQQQQRQQSYPHHHLTESNDTLMNYIDIEATEDDDSRKCIQESKFQVKHSTPNRSRTRKDSSPSIFRYSTPNNPFSHNTENIPPHSSQQQQQQNQIQSQNNFQMKSNNTANKKNTEFTPIIPVIAVQLEQPKRQQHLPTAPYLTSTAALPTKPSISTTAQFTSPASEQSPYLMSKAPIQIAPKASISLLAADRSRSHSFTDINSTTSTTPTPLNKGNHANQHITSRNDVQQSFNQPNKLPQQHKQSQPQLHYSLQFQQQNQQYIHSNQPHQRTPSLSSVQVPLLQAQPPTNPAPTPAVPPKSTKSPRQSESRNQVLDQLKQQFNIFAQQKQAQQPISNNHNSIHAQPQRDQSPHATKNYQKLMPSPTISNNSDTYQYSYMRNGSTQNISPLKNIVSITPSSFQLTSNNNHSSKKSIDSLPKFSSAQNPPIASTHNSHNSSTTSTHPTNSSSFPIRFQSQGQQNTYHYSQQSQQNQLNPQLQPQYQQYHHHPHQHESMYSTSQSGFAFVNSRTSTQENQNSSSNTAENKLIINNYNIHNTSFNSLLGSPDSARKSSSISGGMNANNNNNNYNGANRFTVQRPSSISLHSQSTSNLIYDYKGTPSAQTTGTPSNSSAHKRIQSTSAQNPTSQFQLFSSAPAEITAETSRKYLKKGIFQSHKIPAASFFELLAANDYRFYNCLNEIKPAINLILVISAEFVLVIKHSDLLERRLQTRNKEPFRVDEFVHIKQVFLVRTLLKITSKKFDKTMHSFYFKLPRIEKMQQRNMSNVLNFAQNFSLPMLYDIIHLRSRSAYVSYLSDKSKPLVQTDFLESKTTLKILGGEIYAADCIKMAQTYFQATKNLNVPAQSALKQN